MSDGESPTHGLLDTNTVILLARLRGPQQLPSVPAITTVSLAELSVGPWWPRRSGNGQYGKPTCDRRRRTSAGSGSWQCHTLMPRFTLSLNDSASLEPRLPVRALELFRTRAACA